MFLKLPNNERVRIDKNRLEKYYIEKRKSATDFYVCILKYYNEKPIEFFESEDKGECECILITLDRELNVSNVLRSWEI